MRNIYTALKRDYPSFQPPPKNGGLLTPWADQGVLLLNTCLTVRAGEANSHSGHGWEKFTQKVIDVVTRVRTRGVVFLAWGTPAQKRCAKITGTRHLVLKSVHPSPLSASRGFFECGHFKKTNEWLKTRYGEAGMINWNLNVTTPIKPPDSATAEKAAASQEKTTDRPTTEPAAIKGNTGAREEESDYDDDQDAIEALEELAKSGANGDLDSAAKTATAEQEATNVVAGEEVETKAVEEAK